MGEYQCSLPHPGKEEKQLLRLAVARHSRFPFRRMNTARIILVIVGAVFILWVPGCRPQYDDNARVRPDGSMKLVSISITWLPFSLA